MLRIVSGLCGLLLVLNACSLSNSGVGDGPAGGDAVVRQFLATNASLAPYQVGSPYQVSGVTYTPRENFAYVESGIASFYASSLSGARTASGETYSPNMMTAAHKTLPIQTIVRVTRRDTGRSVIVRINDRGPFISGRIIDLSERAARELDMLSVGTTQVRVQVLEQETKTFRAALANGRVIPGNSSSPTTASTPQAPAGEGAVVPVQNTPAVQPGESQPSGSGGYYVLVGTYTSQADANAIRERMSSLGNARVEQSGGSYRVFIGPLNSQLDAQAMLGRVFAQGATNASVVQR